MFNCRTHSYSSSSISYQTSPSFLPTSLLQKMCQQHNTMPSSAALLILLAVLASTVAAPALAKIPGLPRGIPGVPGGIPGIPGVPGGIPGTPAGEIPEIPGFPGVIPGVPGGIPEIPGIPGGIPGVPAGGIPGIPGLPGGIPWVPGGTDCLVNLNGIPGCIQEVVRSFASRQVTNIGSSCCKVLLDGGDRCWMRFSQFSPVSLGTVKDYCRSRVQAAAPSPVPASLLVKKV